MESIAVAIVFPSPTTVATISYNSGKKDTTVVVVRLLSKCVLACGLLSPALSATPNNLTVGYGYHNAPPYAIISTGTLQSGIIKDIADALAAKANIKVSFKEVNRLDLDNQLNSGELDMNCIANPAWFKQPERFVWSGPLFVEQDRLYGPPDDKRKVDEIGDLSLTRVGTIRGFHYPTLESQFEQHNIQRSDASKHADNFAALLNQQVDYVIADNITTNYLVHSSGEQRFTQHQLKISEHQVHCMFSAKSKFDTKQLASLLDKLAESGEIDRIINHYAGEVPGGR
ncbi:hypothetical protein DU002_10375 [Corallincola holothuriorum]|uniref:Solute-binding protein family 3/N-terminal domain-containing protein n=1 Tax=Corallincola holothuriorum TaxID=2282215 RepID=A0A368NIM9_9GAMM|nr:hypothetical protein DU002_10375 [Corallincola holothuriorum]